MLICITFCPFWPTLETYALLTSLSGTSNFEKISEWNSNSTFYLQRNFFQVCSISSPAFYYETNLSRRWNAYSNADLILNEKC